MWDTGIKTEGGVLIRAQQRVRKNTPIEVQSCRVSADIDGCLTIKSDIGDERGAEITITVSLEEIFAWLPELHEKSKEFAAGPAVRPAQKSP